MGIGHYAPGSALPAVMSSVLVAELSFFGLLFLQYVVKTAIFYTPSSNHCGVQMCVYQATSRFKLCIGPVSGIIAPLGHGVEV